MSYWLIAMAIWFLLYGLLAITNFRFEHEQFIMGVLAIVVAVLIFFSYRRSP